jgi:hypothetical protein
MTALKTTNNIFRTALLATLAFASTLAQAQSVGDWQTVPSLANAYWDNSTNNSLDNLTTWQMWNGSAWVSETGTNGGTSYPSNNTGVITILTGTTITNASSGTATNIADGIVVQNGASFVFGTGSFTLGGQESIDLDVSGNFTLANGNEPLFFMNSGATIVMESGSTMTNNGDAGYDNFAGPGYTNTVSNTWVSNAITFKSGSTYSQQFNGASEKGFIPHATWEPGSTCLIAPINPTTGVSLVGGFIPEGLGGQTFYDFIWNWTNEGPLPNSFGKSEDAGSFTVAHNFYMTASGPTCTNKDFPYSGYTMTVGGNIGLTNVAWVPTGTSGTVTLNVGGNFLVDTTAAIKINNATAIGNVNFTGSSPQTLGIYGLNASDAGWNWTVNSGATVNLDCALNVSAGAYVVAGVPSTGFLTNNGTIDFTAKGTLSGNSNTIILGPNSTINLTAAAEGAWTFAANNTLEGSGKIVGDFTAGTPSVIYPNSGAALTFSGTLTYGGATATSIFNLTSSPSGANDQIVVNGPGTNGSILHPNGAQIVINPLTTLATSDYVLFNVTGGGTIAASAFIATPAWLTNAPANSNNYSIVTGTTNVLLHYAVPVVPQPDITSFSISGTTNLLLNGTNGIAGSYIVLMSTNLNSTNWTPVATNPVIGNSFSITATNVVTPGDRQQFFKLQAP